MLSVKKTSLNVSIDENINNNIQDPTACFSYECISYPDVAIRKVATAKNRNRRCLHWTNIYYLVNKKKIQVQST